MAADALRGELVFLAIKDASKEESRRNARLAKSHTAKVLNRKKRESKKSQCSIDCDAVVRQMSQRPAGHSLDAAKGQHGDASVRGSYSQAKATTASDSLTSFTSCPPTLSPVVGGLAIYTFDWTYDFASVNMIEYCACPRTNPAHSTSWKSMDVAYCSQCRTIAFRPHARSGESRGC